MAKKKAKKVAKAAAGRGKKKAVSSGEFIISKSRTKAAASTNVAGDFYAALDAAVRSMIAAAEARAMANGRKTLRPQDL